MKKPESGCCPKFNPKLWDKKTKVFKDKLFVKDHVTSFLHIPLNFGKVMIRNMNKIWNAKASPKKWSENILLSDEKSLWGSDIYIGVSKKVPNATNVKVSGTYLTKVYEGPYKDMSKWIKDMKAYVLSKKKTIKKILFFYTTCPKCAKFYGKNYVVLLAKVR
ncbi:hydrolase [Nanoarchaeota archaeon]